MTDDWKIAIWWIIGFGIFFFLVLWGPERVYSGEPEYKRVLRQHNIPDTVWNRYQIDYQNYLNYQKYLKERNLRIQREKRRINSFNRNPMVERKPSNPITFEYPPPQRSDYTRSRTYTRSTSKRTNRYSRVKRSSR